MTKMRKLSRFERIYTKIAKNYVRYHPKYSFKFFFDDIEYHQIGNSKEIVEVRFMNSRNTIKRILTEGSMALGETYCEGLIQVDDKDYKKYLDISVRTYFDTKLMFSLPLLDIFKIARAKFAGKFFSFKDQHENINSHYSLSNWFENRDDSNKFYMYWLNSKYVQYTCAKWDPETKSLEKAQETKLHYYAKRLGIDKNSKGKTVLDLGCGWGGFIFFLAEKYGMKCKGITLSTAQAEYIQKEIKKRKLQKLVTVDNINAHDMYGTYDYIVSVGLLEHIDNYNDLFKKTYNHLAPEGSALFHAMFTESIFYKSDPFLLKYIFPGGATPNINKCIRVFKKYFKEVHEENLPDLSYPRTLDCWYEKFCKNQDKIRKLLEQKSKCQDIDYAIRIFKHYLVLASCGLSIHNNVFNIAVKK